MNSSTNPIGPLLHEAAFELDFRIRQPRTATPKACVVLLHGVGGNEMNLADLALAIDPDVLVVLPRGPLPLAPGQFGWFRVDFTPSGPRIVEKEAEDSRHALIRFVEQLQTIYGVEAGHTVIAGFSQGGIVSASVALSAPERVAGFAILSGRILPEIEAHLASRERLAPLRAFIGHGEYDSVLPVKWAQRAEQWLGELGVDCEAHRYPVDHVLSTATQADFLAWAKKLTDIQTPYAASRVGIADGVSTTLLHIGADHTVVASGESAKPAEVLMLAIGAQKTSNEHFKHEPPTPGEMENAIMVVEDALAGAKRLIPPDSRLMTTDAAIREIALLAGLPDQAEMILSLEAMEQTFDRLAAVTLGRPASLEGIPADRVFATRLLILREFMHHLNFASITIKT